MIQNIKAKIVQNNLTFQATQVCPNITLKQLNEDRDAEDFFNLVEENRRFLEPQMEWVDFISSVEKSRGFIETVNFEWKFKKSQMVIGIFYHEKLTGAIGLNSVDLEKKYLDVGYWISEKYQGKGIVSLSVQTVIDYCIKHFQIKNLTLKCTVCNIKSKFVAKRCGFYYKETKLSEECIREKMWDVDYFQRFDEEVKVFRLGKDQKSIQTLIKIVQEEFKIEKPFIYCGESSVIIDEEYYKCQKEDHHELYAQKLDIVSHMKIPMLLTIKSVDKEYKIAIDLQE